MLRPELILRHLVRKVGPPVGVSRNTRPWVGRCGYCEDTHRSTTQQGALAALGLHVALAHSQMSAYYPVNPINRKAPR